MVVRSLSIVATPYIHILRMPKTRGSVISVVSSRGFIVYVRSVFFCNRHTHTHAHTDAHIQTDTHIHTHTHTHTGTQTHLHLI